MAKTDHSGQRKGKNIDFAHVDMLKFRSSCDLILNFAVVSNK